MSSKYSNLVALFTDWCVCDSLNPLHAHDKSIGYDFSFAFDTSPLTQRKQAVQGWSVSYAIFSRLIQTGAIKVL